MSNFFAAVMDLLEFALSFFKPKNSSDELFLLSSNEVPPLAEAEVVEAEFQTLTAETQKTTSLFNPKNDDQADEGQIAFIGVAEARVWVRPVLTFDGESWHVPYATKVEVLSFEGRFAKIKNLDHQGWVLKDELITDKSDIYPTFNQGEIYGANHPETKKLRTLYRDQFAARELFLPLQDVEYVSHELALRGSVVPWGERRPRLAGNWQNLLKGALGVSISINPKANSVMEFIREDGIGFVGFVESVDASGGINLRALGRLIEGEYTNEFLLRAKWQEWRPVFIQIT